MPVKGAIVNTLTRNFLRPGAFWAPLASLYGTGVLLRRVAYDQAWLQHDRVAAKTISVGGLEAGGTGKTPVTALLLRALLREERRVGLLTRGYGRAAQELVVRRPGEPALPAAMGDEPAMLVDSGLDVFVAAYPRRIEGARALVELGCDTLVLDDGFAHRALGRDVDIVVLRGEAPFGNGHLLPWGTLREPPSSLRRAHVLWLHFRAGEPELSQVERVHRFAPQAKIVVSRSIASSCLDASGQPVSLADTSVVAAAGIARPSEFAVALAKEGARVSELVALRDHHAFDAEDVRSLVEKCLTHGARAVVVTPKDAIKLRALWPKDGAALWVMGTQVAITAGQESLAAVLGVAVRSLERMS